MGGCMSCGDTGRSSRTESSSSSKAERPRGSRDLIRDRANASREQSPSGSDSYGDTTSQHGESSPRHTGEISDITHLDDMEQACIQAIENGRGKMEKYQLEAQLYQYQDRDTMQEFLSEEFEKCEVQKSAKGTLYVEIRSGKNSPNSRYYNEFDINEGIITARSNTRDSGLPLSEIIFHQLRLSLEEVKKDLSDFDLKIWKGKSITGHSTTEIIKLFVNPNETKTFYKDSDEFIALAGMETAQSKFYLLAQHPNAFRRKEVTSITVERQRNKTLNISYTFG